LARHDDVRSGACATQDTGDTRTKAAVLFRDLEFCPALPWSASHRVTSTNGGQRRSWGQKPQGGSWERARKPTLLEVKNNPSEEATVRATTRLRTLLAVTALIVTRVRLVGAGTLVASVRPMWRKPRCGGVRVEQVPWAALSSRFTLAFEEMVAYLACH
jgi:hypothetical protein